MQSIEIDITKLNYDNNPLTLITCANDARQRDQYYKN